MSAPKDLFELILTVRELCEKVDGKADTINKKTELLNGFCQHQHTRINSLVKRVEQLERITAPRKAT